MPPERRSYPLFHRHSSVSTSSQPYSVPSPESSMSRSESTASASKLNPTTTSFIWDHGEKRDDHWQCNHCGKWYRCGHGTSTVRNHLKDAHGMREDKPIPRDQTRIDQSVRFPQHIDSVTLRKLIVEWIVDRRHPFNEVEADSFHRIIEYINQSAVSKIPKAHKTLRNDTMKYYQEAKQSIIELVSISHSKIHLSFDLSTSPNCKALLAIMGHWTSHDYKIIFTLLAIRELEDEHNGENISEVVFEVAKEFNIVDKLGYFVMDNASNNDTTLEELNLRLQEDGHKGFDPIERRL